MGFSIRWVQRNLCAYATLATEDTYTWPWSRLRRAYSTMREARSRCGSTMTGPGWRGGPRYTTTPNTLSCADVATVFMVCLRLWCVCAYALMVWLRLWCDCAYGVTALMMWLRLWCDCAYDVTALMVWVQFHRERSFQMSGVHDT